jgi:hypothetical protein
MPGKVSRLLGLNTVGALVNRCTQHFQRLLRPRRKRRAVREQPNDLQQACLLGRKRRLNRDALL